MSYFWPLLGPKADGVIARTKVNSAILNLEHLDRVWNLKV